MGKTLGEVIANARNKKGWTLRTLEEHSGVHNAHLSQIEKGVILRPAPNALWPISLALELDYATLLDLAGHVDHGPASPRRSLAGAALNAFQDLSPKEQEEALRYLESVRRERSGVEDASGAERAS